MWIQPIFGLNVCSEEKMNQGSFFGFLRAVYGHGEVYGRRGGVPPWALLSLRYLSRWPRGGIESNGH